MAPRRMRRWAGAIALLLVVGAVAWTLWPGYSPEVARQGPRLLARPVATLSDDPAPARQVAFSADGRWLATTSAAGPVVLRRLPDLAVVRRFRHPDGATSVAFGPDGRWLATAGYDGGINLWDPSNGRLLRRLEGASGTIWTLDVSPDGQRLAAAGEDKLIRVWDVATGRLALRLQGHEKNIWEVRFSPDGRRLASGSFDRTARLWDSATGAPRYVLTEHKQAVVGLDWSADGRFLATSGDDSTILVRRAADGKPVRRIEVGNHAYKLDFSPDGRFLAEAGRARSAAGTFLHGLTGLGGEADSVHLWRVADGALVAALKLPEDAGSIAFSPDGHLLATAGEDGKVVLWTLEPR